MPYKAPHRTPTEKSWVRKQNRHEVKVFGRSKKLAKYRASYRKKTS